LFIGGELRTDMDYTDSEEGQVSDIDRNFTYHPPKEGQPERYAKIRAKAKELAELIDAECPKSRERSIAMTDLENSVFWANAAIARNE